MERLYEDLNDEQKKVVRAPAPLFVPACPGAGKTRTLVARTLRILNERTDPGRGVALLSFTNNATREARRRAAQVAMSGHVRFPSFIGTFDAFLNRFFVVPFGSPWAPRRRPEIRDTWKSFGIQPIRLKGLSCPEGIGIDELVVEEHGAVRLDIERVSPRMRSLVEQHYDRWSSELIRIRDSQLRTGRMTAVDVRVVARNRLRDSVIADVIAGMLRSRFVEITVDEAQDCDPSEVELLEWLHARGLPLVVVADPDQAIYEWRGSNVEALQTLAAKLTCQPLVGNYRSSQNICNAFSTLRDGRATDDARGTHADHPAPVFVIPYKGRPTTALRDEFGVVQALHPPESTNAEAVVLAHAESTVRAALGLADATQSSAHALLLFDAARDFFTRAAHARMRLRAVETAAAAVTHRLTGQRPWSLHLRDQAVKAGTTEAYLKDAALELLGGTGPTGANDFHAWFDRARDVFGKLEPPVGRKWERTEGQILPKRSDVSVGERRDDVHGVAGFTIHRAKGCEFDAVLVVVPPNGAHTRTNELVDDWVLGRTSEAKRVLYVGLSRARRLLAIAVPHTHCDRIVGCLEAKGCSLQVREPPVHASATKPARTA